jgi:hypothetical protein
MLYAQGNGCGVTKFLLGSAVMKVLTLNNTPGLIWRWRMPGTPAQRARRLAPKRNRCSTPVI